jgi:hypothetical protein
VGAAIATINGLSMEKHRNEPIVIGSFSLSIGTIATPSNARPRTRARVTVKMLAVFLSYLTQISAPGFVLTSWPNQVVPK